MVNPYAPGFRVVPSQFNFWRVLRLDGTFVGIFPREHFREPCDVRNLMKLMSTAFERGVEVGSALPSPAEKVAS